MQVMIAAALLTLVGFVIVMVRRAGANRATPNPAEHREPIEPVEPPEHVRQTLRDAEKLGRAIWRFDTAAARANDVLVDSLPDRRLPEQPMFGWVVTEDGADGDALHVHFLGEAGADLEVLYRVRIGGEGAPPVVEILDPPIALAPHVRGPATALRSARKAQVPRVDAPYNEVVVPAELVGQAGWLVYALAATANAEEMMVGGHARIKVSADGTTIEEVFAFSRTDLRVPAGTEVAMTTLTHIVSETPLEHHVFLSLLHRQHLRVLTELGAWDVEHGRIVYGGPFPT